MLPKILVVDDEEGIRMILQMSLSDLGYGVETAASGEEALGRLGEVAPDIVLADIKMPGMDGIELLQRIKAARPDTEVIMISGHGDMDLAIKSLQHDAVDFVTKPIRDEILQIALKRARERIDAREEVRRYTQNLERLVREKSQRLVELERQMAVGQVVEGMSSALKGLTDALEGGPGYFNELPCFVAVHNRYLEIVATNQLYRERLGDKVGRNSWEVYSGSSTSGDSGPVWKTVVTGKGHRSRETLVDAAGQEIPVIVNTAPIINKEGEVELVLELSVDVTEVKRLQEELRATRQLYQDLFDKAPCYITVHDRDFRIVAANRRFTEDFGESIGSLCHIAYKHRPEPCDDCPVAKTFEDGQMHHAETVVTSKAGQQYNVLIWTAPIKSQEGEIVQVMEMGTNITQIRQLQDHLASLGLMIGSMSHGVKGLLTALDGGIYRVNLGMARNDRQKIDDGWKTVQAKVDRIRKMVLDILYYAKSRELHTEFVDVATFAEDVASIVEPKAKANSIGFVRAFDPAGAGLGAIEMDEVALSSALVNFLENAVDACAEAQEKDGRFVRFGVTADHGGVTFEIEDNGIGMDQETREKMFTLFFSSKGSKGTGLGLFISNRILEQHGGCIQVESEPGRGTRFLIRLPRVQNATGA